MATKPRKNTTGRLSPTGRLASLSSLTSKTTEVTLLAELQGHLLKKNWANRGDRRQDIIHPSEMAKSDWCPRQTYYRIAKTPEDPGGAERFYNFSLANVFEEGHAIHAKYQRWLAEMGKLSGVWKCSNCGDSFYGVPISDMHCALCPIGVYQYDEVPLHSDNYMIAGHADGAVPGGLIEIKSIGLGTLRFEEPNILSAGKTLTADGREIYDIDKIWKDIRRPFPSHLRQGSIYLRLCEIMGYDDLREITFIYEYKPNQQVKQFVVKHNKNITDPLFEKALDIKYALRVGRPPERPVHGDSPESAICKSCPFRSTCWSLSGGNTVDDIEPAPPVELNAGV